MSAQMGENGAAPKMLLAHADPTYASALRSAFRRQGWEVHEAPDGPEARQLAWKVRPAVVVLDTNLAGESGWLICSKLIRDLPRTRVILIDASNDPRNEALAAFVGAVALVPQSAGIPAVLNECYGMILPVAG
jgi:DNA-binding response OmpR family regulator